MSSSGLNRAVDDDDDEKKKKYDIHHKLRNSLQKLLSILLEKDC